MYKPFEINSQIIFFWYFQAAGQGRDAIDYVLYPIGNDSSMAVVKIASNKGGLARDIKVWKHSNIVTGDTSRIWLIWCEKIWLVCWSDWIKHV